MSILYVLCSVPVLFDPPLSPTKDVSECLCFSQSPSHTHSPTNCKMRTFAFFLYDFSQLSMFFDFSHEFIPCVVYCILLYTFFFCYLCIDNIVLNLPISVITLISIYLVFVFLFFVSSIFFNFYSIFLLSLLL